MNNHKIVEGDQALQPATFSQHYRFVIIQEWLR